MGIDGWQTLTITGPVSDLDEIEFFFKISYDLDIRETRTQLHSEFNELWEIHYMCMQMCRENPSKMVGWFGTQSEKYTRLLETEGGKLFKQMIYTPRVNQLGVDAMYELRKHTLLTSWVRRKSPKELIVGHAFRNRPTFSFVECLAGFFPQCWFKNYCKIEDGQAEINIIHSKSRNLWDYYWTCLWDEYPDYCPIPSYEKYGISSKDNMKESRCGCISLGLPKCFMTDPSQSYNVTMYADFSGRLCADWKKVDQEFKDFHMWLISKGIELIGPDGKPYDSSDEFISIEHYKYQRDIQGILFGTENPKTKFSAVHFKCILKGQNPKDLLQLFCKKYIAAYWWCSYEDTERKITGVIEKDVSYHYPYRVED